ncbi:LytR/AlgR family response regulator transcription factor [Enterococcus sp. HY326]|uniref:LytR/AlgR family response regulator transcription factor n=1 Tax=Enterococcus sp. HY326 TaxID=2971265 RepID=UPI00223FD33A|nr:LytTR family DNA-binding domain-containing protein [Enterococcus sp. HY326]
MAINIYIAEDNFSQRQQLVAAIENYALFSNWEMKIVSAVASGEELLASIDHENQWNVYFLDINLAEDAKINNGFLVSQKIRVFDPFGFIVFITVRSELSFLTFQYRVQALDFIIKDPAVNIAERVHSCLKTVEQRLNSLTNSQTLHLNTGNDLQSFLVDDILYLSANKGHVLSLFTREDSYPIYLETLNHLETELANSFIRCHRSYLVNQKAIQQIAKDFKSLSLNDGTIIPISVRKKTQVRAFLQGRDRKTIADNF